VNRRLHAGIHGCGTSEISTALAGNCLGKVAGPAAAVHRLPGCGKSEPLLRSLVRLDLAFAFALAHPSSLTSFSEILVFDRLGKQET
jgi:hypothetical protein